MWELSRELVFLPDTAVFMLSQLCGEHFRVICMIDPGEDSNLGRVCFLDVGVMRSLEGCCVSGRVSESLHAITMQ